MSHTLSAAAASRRRYLTFGLAGMILIAGQALWPFHDALLLAALVLAGGLVWTAPGRNGWIVALLIASAGVGWSSVDPHECSAWWRGKLVYEKLAGHLAYIDWGDIKNKALSPCCSFYRVEDNVKRSITLLGEKAAEGKKIELYQTPLGAFWIPAPGKNLLTWLVWELTMQHDYESRNVKIRAGDTVIDGGAHVGTFTRYALQHGAARVIAIEPEAVNLVCLKTNLSLEIAAGQVKVIEAGIWDQKTVLTLSDARENSAGHSFVREVPDSTKVGGLPVLTLDEIVEQLQLHRVDFIKMDIEGAERRALAGARRTLARFKPRMAISSYHLHDDPAAIPAVVAPLQPAYRIHAKDFEDGPHRLITKVLFFE